MFFYHLKTRLHGSRHVGFGAGQGKLGARCPDSIRETKVALSQIAFGTIRITQSVR